MQIDILLLFQSNSSYQHWEKVSLRGSSATAGTHLAPGVMLLHGDGWFEGDKSKDVELLAKAGGEPAFHLVPGHAQGIKRVLA